MIHHWLIYMLISSKLHKDRECKPICTLYDYYLRSDIDADNRLFVSTLEGVCVFYWAFKKNKKPWAIKTEIQHISAFPINISQQWFYSPIYPPTPKTHNTQTYKSVIIQQICQFHEGIKQLKQSIWENMRPYLERTERRYLRVWWPASAGFCQICFVTGYERWLVKVYQAVTLLIAWQ